MSTIHYAAIREHHSYVEFSLAIPVYGKLYEFPFLVDLRISNIH